MRLVALTSFAGYQPNDPAAWDGRIEDLQRSACAARRIEDNRSLVECNIYH